MSLRVIVAVTSASALLEVDGTPSLIRAIHDLLQVFPEESITIAVDSVNEPAVSQLLKKNLINHSLVICDPNQPKELARALAPIIKSSEALLLHDACRPMTSHDQIDRVVGKFTADIDAVRPAIAFTETLKVLGPNSHIEGTLDRTKVKRISTPELIRTSAVNLEGTDQGWFLPLKKNAHTRTIEGNPESIRMNSLAERQLLESFLHWKTNNN